jgi:phospholipid N-methyltransferase
MIEGSERTPGMHVAELGAGTGRFTAEIAAWLPEDGLALAIDIDPVFVERLVGRWPRVECVCDRAEHLADLARARGWGPFDHIVSGLPFASLPADTTRLILHGVDRCLREGGTFTTFQYVHAWHFRAATSFRRAATRVLEASPTTKLVVGNVPSAIVLRWQKPLTVQIAAAGRSGPDATKRSH